MLKTSCPYKFLGLNSKSGLTAYDEIKSNELLIKMTRECAICPSDILDYFPFVNYLRGIWKQFHGTDHDDILTLISYLLLTEGTFLFRLIEHKSYLQIFSEFSYGYHPRLS